MTNSLWPRGLYSPPGSSVHGILQARVLEWDAISSSRGIFLNPHLLHWQVDSLPLSHLGNLKGNIVLAVQWLSCVQLFATPWTASCQASLSITISLSLLKLMCIEWVKPSNHFILCCLLLLLPPIFPNLRGFFQWVSSLHQLAKLLELQLQHQFS